MEKEGELPTFQKNSIADYQIYSLYQATIKNQQVYAKVFYQDALKKYHLEEVIQYNMEVLYHQYQTLQFKEYILPIKKVYPHEKGLVFVIDKYDIKLSEFIKKQNLQENQARAIAQDILKAIYGLLIPGYFHKNLRLEHFVKHKGVWKLESLVFHEEYQQNLTPNEYIALPEYKTSEMYNSENLEEKQIDEKIVWDFGSILIDMLLGHHPLKDLETLKKFENQEFSFSKIGAKIGNYFTPQFRNFLGRMCHYDPIKRMKFKELVCSGYFSEEVKSHYLSQKEHDSSRDQSSIPPSIDQLSQLSEKQKDSDIFNRFQNATNIKSLQEIEKFCNKEQKDKLMVQFRNSFEKEEILKTALKMIQSISDLEQQKKFKQIIILTRYAIHFIIAMDIYSLAKALAKKNIPKPFEVQLAIWNNFCESQPYIQLTNFAVSKKNQALSKLTQIQSQILNSNKQILQEATSQVYSFIKNAKAQKSVFSKIKKPYRQIIKKPYDLVSWYYLQKQSHEKAKVGMYLTYCLAIDKIYRPKQMKESFDFYIKWTNSNNPKGVYISSKKFEDYIELATKEQLVKNSRKIIMKYFKY